MKYIRPSQACHIVRSTCVVAPEARVHVEGVVPAGQNISIRRVQLVVVLRGLLEGVDVTVGVNLVMMKVLLRLVRGRKVRWLEVGGAPRRVAEPWSRRERS